jgi:hypothetical protein
MVRQRFMIDSDRRFPTQTLCRFPGSVVKGDQPSPILRGLITSATRGLIKLIPSEVHGMNQAAQMLAFSHLCRGTAVRDMKASEM